MSTATENVQEETTALATVAPVGPFESSELSLDEQVEAGRKRYLELADVAGRAGVGCLRKQGDLLLEMCNLKFGTTQHLRKSDVYDFLATFGNPEASDISKERTARYAILSAHLIGVHACVGSIPSAKHVHAIMLKTDLKFDHKKLLVECSLESLAKARDFALAYLSKARGTERENHMKDVAVLVGGEKGRTQSDKEDDKATLADDTISQDLRQHLLKRNPDLNPIVADTKKCDAMLKRFAKAIDKAELTAASRAYLASGFELLICELETAEEHEALVEAGIYQSVPE